VASLPACAVVGTGGGVAERGSVGGSHVARLTRFYGTMLSASVSV
jgi:hypothetical protein